MLRYTLLLSILCCGICVADECPGTNVTIDHWNASDSIAIGVVLKGEVIPSPKENYDHVYWFKVTKQLKGAHSPARFNYITGFPGAGLSIGHTYVLFFDELGDVDASCSPVVEIQNGEMTYEEVLVRSKRKDMPGYVDISTILKLYSMP